MKAVVAAFNQEKALVGAFSVITNLRMELFQALVITRLLQQGMHDYCMILTVTQYLLFKYFICSADTTSKRHIKVNPIIKIHIEISQFIVLQ